MNPLESLYIVEQELYKARMMSNISLNEIKNSKERLDLDAVYNIEGHKEYMIESLVKYANVLGIHLYLDDQPVENLSDIGKILRVKREQAGLTKIGTYPEVYILPKTISRIESGKNYRKSTFVKYSSYFDVHFTIKD